MDVANGEPNTHSVLVPSNGTALQYVCTTAGTCSNTFNTNYCRILHTAHPAKAQNYAGVRAFGDGAYANYNFQAELMDATGAVFLQATPPSPPNPYIPVEAVSSIQVKNG